MAQSLEEVETESKGERAGELGDSGSVSESPLSIIPLSPKDWNDVDALVEAMGRPDLQAALLDSDYSERFYNLCSLYRDSMATLVAMPNLDLGKLVGVIKGKALWASFCVSPHLRVIHRPCQSLV